ncbi:hypothetical protein C8Q73DRAFT_678729 [Cubamyces lactineus]|nr:hypothetical protein C8Q73DRAFT_678729 [Cubamyces lactineus]
MYLDSEEYRRRDREGAHRDGTWARTTTAGRVPHRGRSNAATSTRTREQKHGRGAGKRKRWVITFLCSNNSPVRMVALTTRARPPLLALLPTATTLMQ